MLAAPISASQWEVRPLGTQAHIRWPVGNRQAPTVDAVFLGGIECRLEVGLATDGVPPALPREGLHINPCGTSHSARSTGLVVAA